jgi:hypothetical protein
MFSNPFSMVVAIVLITTIGHVVRAKIGVTSRKERRHGVMTPAVDSAETQAMREEIKTLKERIAVLERIATDTNAASALDREIEKLR